MALKKGKTFHFTLIKYQWHQIILETYLREIKRNPISQETYSPDELIELEIYGELLEKVNDVLKKLFYDFDAYATKKEVREDLCYVQRNQKNISNFLKKGLIGIRRSMTLPQRVKYFYQNVKTTFNILTKDGNDDSRDINHGI